MSFLQSNRLNKRAILSALFFITSLSFPGLAPSYAEAADTTLSSSRVISAAIPRNWPPHYMTDSSGNPDGFAIESMNEIARIADVKIHYRTYPSFAKAMTALENKDVDLVPNVGIADFRKKFASFTAPVETFLVSAFVRSGTLTEQQLGANWLDILKGRTTAVIINNVGQRVLAKQPEVPTIIYENVHEAIFDLIAGRIDALVYPEAVVHRIIRSIGIADKIQMAGTPLKEIKRGVAIRNNFPELHQRLSIAVDTFVKSDNYQEIYSRWFGAEKPFWTTRNLILYIGLPVAVLLVLLIAWRYFSVMRLNQRLVESRESLANLNVELESRVLERTQDIAKEKKHAENYLNIAGTMIVALDAQGCITLVNRKARDILGWNAEDLIGYSWFDMVIPENERSDVRRAFQQILAGQLEPVEHFENDVLTSRGEHRLVAWHNTYIWDDNGNIVGCLSAGEDITDSRKIQAKLIQSSKMATLGEMATGVAHELNQPLNIIRLVVNNILRKSDKNAVEPDYLNDKLGKIDDQIERATAIIDHMRIFGRKPGAVPVPLDPKHMVDSTLRLIGEQLRLAEIQVITEAPENRSPVLGHQVQIEQVLLNMLGNARDILKTKPDGDKNISVTIGEGDNSIFIAIEDTGGGIDEDALPRIFEPFFTTKEIGQGTGLGLSISYGIINDMGGTITAANTDDGARFLITLPAYENETAAA